jgi:hypothetical protein
MGQFGIARLARPVVHRPVHAVGAQQNQIADGAVVQAADDFLARRVVRGVEDRSGRVIADSVVVEC